MKPLHDLVDEELVADLRERSASGEFPGLTLKHMLEFLLSDGILPESGLPVASFLALEDWVRGRAATR